MRSNSQIRQQHSLHRTIWYMGAKARVIPGFLADVLGEEVPEGGTVVDLMSGTGVVAAFCADRYRVLANDVEAYAAVIARSLIEHPSGDQETFLSGIDPERDLGREYHRNCALLEEIYARPLEMEAALLERLASGERDERWCRDYRRFLELPGSVYGCASGPAGRGDVYEAAAELVEEGTQEEYRRDPRRRPACLVTTYYANIYFGLRQAIALDSLRAAIDELGEHSARDGRKRVHYLSALLHTASTCTSGTSHFAQPRHLRKDSEVLAMGRRRQTDILDRLRVCSRDIAETVRRTRYRAGNRCLVGDYKSLIREDGVRREGPCARFDFPSRPDLVYFDPPYTADNYSRFYHVLDVLARYDYPRLQKDSRGLVSRGRYPEIAKRFQSGFSSKSRVEAEFRTVIEASAGCGAKLVISYASPSGLLLKRYASRFPGEDPVSRLEDLCREYYGSVSTRRLPVLHSGQGDKNQSVEELLVICREPRCGVTTHGDGHGNRASRAAR